MTHYDYKCARCGMMFQAEEKIVRHNDGKCAEPGCGLIFNGGSAAGSTGMLPCKTTHMHAFVAELTPLESPK